MSGSGNLAGATDNIALSSLCRSGLVSLSGAHDAPSTDRLCRAAREIKYPHGKYVGRGAPCSHVTNHPAPAGSNGAQLAMQTAKSMGVSGLILSLTLVGACAETPPCERDVEAFVIAQDFIRRSLASPATAQFPLMDGRENTSTVIKTPEGICAFNVAINVDAQNSFGATVRQRFYVRVAPDMGGSHEWRLLSMGGG